MRAHVTATSFAILFCLVTGARADPAEIAKPLKGVKNEHDTIRIKVEKGKVDHDSVQFVLKIAPSLHWHKKIKAFDADGPMCEIEVRDALKHAETGRLKVEALDRVEIGKAVGFPIPNDTHWDYKISDLRTMGGSRITLEWEKD